LKDEILRIADVMLDGRALGALLSWPVFSITSYRMVRSLAEQRIAPMTVIDVGSNVGQFGVAAARIFTGARIYCVEPQPDNFGRLCRNVRKLRNVTTFQAAVGDREGTAQLRVNSHSHSSSILPLAPAHCAAFPQAVEVGTVSVEVTTLDRLFAPIELRPPVLLKLDVQGYEAWTLRGGAKTLRAVDYTVLEASFKPMYEGEALFLDLVRIMEGCGFRFCRPVGLLSDPATGEVLQIDALFERTGMASDARAPEANVAF
jgi:FkbM family methyltransferase